MRIAIVQSQAALSGVQQNLREGDFVFVKTLKNLGGGKYTVSFAGGRFDVVSERALQEGQSFRAQVSVLDGKVLLSPVLGHEGAAEAAGMASLEGDAAAFLAGMGLAADSVSERVLRFLIQSGAKLDAALMRKVLRLAAKFKGGEASAAESALVLEEKGIDSDGEALDKLMDLLDGGGEKRGGQSDDGDFLLELNGGKDSRAEREHDSARENDNARQNDSASGASGGRESSAKKNWTFFPYQFLNGGGVIRLCSDSEKNAPEKMIVNFKSSGANIFFAVYFGKDRKVSAIRASASEGGLQEFLRAELPALAAAFGQGVKAEVVPSEKFSAYGVLDLPVFGVEAFA